MFAGRCGQVGCNRFKDKCGVEVDPREDVMGATWLASRYQVAGLRARGALSLIYQGQDAVLQRPVAIKAPFPEHAEIYRATLAPTSALAHPAFLALYDVVEQGDGLFLAYEFIEGRPLADYIATGLPLRRALALILQVLRALVYAHAHGVGHGDLTPAAILVDRAAVARVTNVGMPPDEQYFDEVATNAYDSGIASDPDLTATILTERIERMDTWAAAAIFWLLITDVSAESSEAARIRIFREDTPDHLREVVERTLRVNHAHAITAAEALESELTALEAQLTVNNSESEEPVPATISALRAVRARSNGAAAGMAGGTNIRWRGVGANVVSPTATTSYGEPNAEELTEEDPNITNPSDDAGYAENHLYQAQAPRLRLPSRPIDSSDPRLLGATYVTPRRQEVEARGSFSGWVWALISLAVFMLSFLAGFFLIPLIPLPHLP